MSKIAKVTGGEEPFLRRQDYGPRSWINIRNVPEGGNHTSSAIRVVFPMLGLSQGKVGGNGLTI